MGKKERRVKAVPKGRGLKKGGIFWGFQGKALRVKLEGLGPELKGFNLREVGAG